MGARGFYQNVCRTTEHTRSIASAFRFQDPAMERRYQAETHPVHLFMARVHSFFLFLAAGSLLSYYVTTTVAPLSLWVTTARTAFPLLFFLLTFGSRTFRRNIVAWHALFCITISALLGWLVFATADVTMKSMQHQLGPNMFVDQRTGPYFFQSIGIVVSNYCQSQYTSSNRWQMIALAFIGYNHWTVAALASFSVAFFVAIVMDPYFVPFSLVCNITEHIAGILAFLFIAIWIEQLRRAAFLKEQLLQRELYTSQESDSILNHTLKNTLADAAGNIEMFLTDPTGADGALLEDCMRSLRRGIRSCRDRQAYLKLVAGKYAPRLTSVNLQKFGADLIAGRPVRGAFPDLTVLLDTALCNLIFDNSISNALRHGDPANPDVQFAIAVDDLREAAADTLDDLEIATVMFEVRNRANPDIAPLTPDRVARAFNGDALHAVDLSGLSDRIGLSHCRLAAEAHGLALTLGQEGDFVYFRAMARLKVTDPRGSSPRNEKWLSRFPAGLRFCLLDDSPTSLRLMAAQLTLHAAPATVQTYGEAMEEVEAFVAAALDGADVVVCDQNLQYGHMTYLGTDLVRALRDAGFKGLLCIRSADMSHADVALYKSHGAHCALGKELPAKEFVEGIKLAYMEAKYGGTLDTEMVLPYCVPLGPEGEALGQALC